MSTLGAFFRTTFAALVPSWLSRGDGEDSSPGESPALYTMALLQDAAAERAYQGLQARFPSRGPESALALTGIDRGIPRGRSETPAHYAARLIAWRYPRGHRVRGNAYAMLDQVWEYWGGVVHAIAITVRGIRHDRTASSPGALQGVESVTYGNAWNWDGAPSSPAWGRGWVVLAPPTDGSWSAAGEFDAPTLGMFGVEPGDARAMRGLFANPRPWKAAGTRAEWVVIALDGTLPPDLLPDGAWLHWSEERAGVQEPTRYAEWRFWSLSPATNNTYAGYPTRYPGAMRMLGGGAYAGANAYPATIPRLNASAYAGNPASFPVSIRLYDDGDAPPA